MERLEARRLLALPAGWGDVDVGLPQMTGAATFDSAAWTVRGGGSDIWNAADQFNFASRTLSGDGSVVARVSSVSNTNP